MSSNEKPLFTPKTLVFDGGLTLLFFIALTLLLRPHVPAESTSWVLFWAAFSALPVTGVFFLAVEMFRATLTDQKRRVQLSE